ncbi:MULTISPECIES: trypsin-like peptidase domain-containing protein [unclassified Streptomyces]|uniref:VMAP-C domain-containing protein n=1 Tax=unclassified Streptomyces TaxID=2593676 RepID=UPI000891871E|nr:MULTISPECIES: trypsin-like peptidase domain-containing protein [unclassified Streptomyces]PBC85025.1 trypsin-like peptidase [Streptomyces sp. 2321.6]SDR23186.1 Trypsin-like peptidase domain-containing protein [Streptomyces sp. KS_16]SED53105.1 Trypsin-like peptidase domain-containing protein [Streptomyces sp. 2133.1]SEE32630.1 Trypsin-like peptidase domain-containing protein [Streptomyces sp. 2112.3]SNC71048.1 Trypsin-like peptidase domain-containing protein [Streptomyces sp. 2114.4]
MTTSEGQAAGRGDRAHYAQLLDHAGRATVALRPAPGAPAGRPWGSGVLIAPGWVLTCAHVLAAGDGRRRGTGPDGVFGVAFGGRVVPARAAYDLSRPDPAAGPAAARADLALVRLLDPETEHPCAWLSDQPATLLEDAYIFRGHDGCGTRGRAAEDGTREPDDDRAPRAPLAPRAGRRAPADPAAPHAPGAPTTPTTPVDPFIAVRFGARDARGLQFGSDVRVTPGASGGPLIDCDRGEVVGIVKGRHQQDHVGLAVPVTALRGLGPEHLVPGAEGLGPDPYHALMSLHDRWHWAGQELGRAAGPTWFDAQHAIMSGRGRLWGVQERLQALDLLARLPAPRDPLLVEAAVGEVLDRGDRPGAWALRTWRDGHGALYQGSDPYTELRAFVHYLRIVAQLTADEVRDVPGEQAAAVRGQALRLAEFVQAKAVVLQPQDRRRIGPVRRRPRSVLVEFEPLFYDEGGPELFNWSVSEGYGQGQWLRVDVQESAGGVPFEQAREQVLRRLGGRLLRADGDAGPGARVRLEVAVPEGHWHTAAGQWEVAASTRRTARLRPVGSGRAVILRDQGRREQVDPAWLRRFQGLAAAPELQALRIAPHPGGDAARGSDEAVWRLLETAAEGALPALCHTVADGFGRDAVGAVLDTGFPAGLWPAGGHGEERGCDAGCEEFHRGVRELLQGSGGLARLPELVRQLRAKAAGAAEEGMHWARDLVLLYDDPEDPIPPLFTDRPQLSPQ